MNATFWDKRSKKYDDNIKKHDFIYEKTIDSTRSLLNNSDVVLDFACASGEMSLDIAPHVQRVHGIDQSIKIKREKKNTIHHCLSVILRVRITSYLYKGLSLILVLAEEALGNISSLAILL